VSVTKADRLATANIVLNSFAAGSCIELQGSHLVVAWTAFDQKRTKMRRRWIARHGQSFYPVWSRRWPHGGTATTALSQLIRWLQGRPVLPISSWRYWSGDKCRLVPDWAVGRLLSGGYPEHADCVLCGQRLGALDWWCLGGISGPCCTCSTGCRQRPPGWRMPSKDDASRRSRIPEGSSPWGTP
jgi:hypothetical protein